MKNTQKLKALWFVSAALLCSAAPLAANAQEWPTRSIRFITPGTPGSTSDIMPRVIGDLLSARFGQPVAVVNRSGGSGLVSANALITSPADGYTIWLGTMGTLCINPHVLPSMPFDPKTAVVPVALAASMPLVLVVSPNKNKVKTLAEFVKLAKANKSGMTYGSAGAGSSPAIAAVILGQKAGVQFTHVPFKGFGPAVQGVVTGEIDMMIPDVGFVMSRIFEGALTPLAVTTAARTNMLPNVPSFKELGYDMDIALWYGVFVKQGTPQPIIDRLGKAIAEGMKDEGLKKRWAQLGLVVGDKFGADFNFYYQQEQKRWGEIIPPLGLKGK